MDAKQKTQALLETVDAIDLNVADLTTLFTCPAGMKCYVMKVVVRDIDIATLNTVKLSFGWDGAATDVVALTGALTIGQNNYYIPTILSDAVRGNAAETFRVDVETAEGEAATCSIDVFGYLVPA